MVRDRLLINANTADQMFGKLGYENEESCGYSVQVLETAYKGVPI